MILKFDGKKYDLKYCEYLGDSVFGEIDDVKKTAKQIRIKEGLSERDEFATYIHEFLHAELRDMTEETISRMEKDLTIALFDKLEYRR